MATTSFLKKLINPGGRSGADAGPARLALAAFGKHPGWNDHIPGIGVETEALAQFKQSMYVTGIGGRIDAGVWKALDAEKRLEGFAHIFLCLRGGHVIAGQMFSSEDGLRRKEYPMVLCVDAEGASPAFIFPPAQAELDRLREACRATASADQVSTACRLAQDRLRGMLAGTSPEVAGLTSPAETRRRFLDHQDLGPDRIGLLRALHELGPVGDSVRQVAPGPGGHGRSCHLRLPLAADSRHGSLVLWGEFLRCAVAVSSPLLLIAREGVDWVDAIIGEPTSDDFFCLQASPKAAPLVTHIPYDLTPALQPRLRQLEAKFLGMESPSPVRPQAPISARETPPPAPAAVTPVNPPERKRFFWLAVLAGIVILPAAVVGVWLFGGNRGSPAESKPLTKGNVEPAPISSSEAPAKNAANPAAAAPVAKQAEEQAAAEAEAKRLADEKRISEEKQAREAVRESAPAAEKPNAASAAVTKSEAPRVEDSTAPAKARAEDAGLAQIAFSQGNYERAAEISRKWAGTEPFQELLAQIQVESNQLAQLTQYLQSGNYTPILNPAVPLPEKGKFNELRTTAAAEKKILDRASTEFAGGDYAFLEWSEVQALRAKPPFQKLLQDGAAEAEQLAKARRFQTASQPQAAKDLIVQGKLQKPPFAKIQQWATGELERVAGEQQDRQTAKSLFEKGDYRGALAIGEKYSGTAAFSSLVTSINEEQKALADAGKKFSAGDYSLVGELSGREYRTKPPFAELLRLVAAEQKSLAELEKLKQAGDWQALQGKLAALPPAVSGKKPFAELRQWTQGKADEQAELRKKDPVWLDAKLEVLLVQLNILKPTDPRIKTPEARQQKVIEGALSLTGVDYYLNQVNILESEYQKGGWLDQGDRKKFIKDLRERIKYGN